MFSLVVVFLFLVHFNTDFPMGSPGGSGFELQANDADSLRLSELHTAAEQNWPTVAQLDRNSDVLSLQLQNLKAAWLPQVHFNASAMYYSEVTQIPFAPPGGTAPSQPHDRYSATFDIQQVIWDAGARREQSEVARASAKTDQQRVLADLYALRAQVNEAFFSAKLLDARMSSLQLIMEELSERLSVMEVRVHSGAALPSHRDAIKAELLRAKQTQIEVESLKKSVLQTLSLLTGISIQNDIELFFDEVTSDSQRPELSYFQAQAELISARSKALDIRLRPQLMAIGQAGLGRPGPNLFDDSVTPYYVLGIQLRWQFFNWGTTQRAKQALKLSMDSIQDQALAFNRAQAIQDATQRQRQEGIREQLKLDEELVSLRTSVAEASATQLEQGTITASEYLGYLNAVHQARLDRDIRAMELQKTQAMIQFINFNRE
jgi:outer membrane protein TolC